MRILAVDTAEESCSLAVIEDAVLVCEDYYSTRITHSRILMEMIESMISHRLNLSISQMDGFVVAKGPGSFTGVRIGVSVVKGLAYATSRPAAGVSSLDGIAFQHSNSPYPVFAMMDAKRGEIYCALYRFSKGRLADKSSEAVLSPEKAVSLVKEEMLFAGSGALVYQEMILKELNGRARFVPIFQNSVRASALAISIVHDPGMLKNDPASILPQYIRRSDAEINYEKH